MDLLYEAQGYQADGITNEFSYIGIQIVEWDEDGNEVWRWNPYDYFTTQDTDLYGGFWHQAFNDGIYDWMHTNAFILMNKKVLFMFHTGIYQDKQNFLSIWKHYLEYGVITRVWSR